MRGSPVDTAVEPGDTRAPPVFTRRRALRVGVADLQDTDVVQPAVADIVFALQPPVALARERGELDAIGREGPAGAGR
jgi:hypothetical protein